VLLLDRRLVQLSLTIILDPPPPPLKVEWLGGSGKPCESFICVPCWTIDQCALVNSHSGPPPPPPPPLKEERLRGVQKLLLVVDLGASASAVDLCTLFNHSAKSYMQWRLRLVIFVGLLSFPCFLSPWGLGNILSNIKDMNQHRSSCMFY
jgi:hypothetical protein